MPRSSFALTCSGGIRIFFTPRARPGQSPSPCGSWSGVSQAYPRHRLSGVEAPTSRRPTYLAYVTTERIRICKVDPARRDPRSRRSAHWCRFGGSLLDLGCRPPDDHAGWRRHPRPGRARRGLRHLWPVQRQRRYCCRRGATTPDDGLESAPVTSIRRRPSWAMFRDTAWSPCSSQFSRGGKHATSRSRSLGPRPQSKRQ